MRSPFAIASFQFVIVMQMTTEVLVLNLVYLSYVTELPEADLITKRQAAFVPQNSA
jgi:hypothetical protein